MYTTTQLDNGILNNYAVEPQVYLATYPSLWQQRRYALQGAVATLLVTGLILTACAVS
ncbi:MAG TPA: ssl1498 family light-harvesting-like protein [Leptolyngbyaceae cyanobacterium M65_K2018_010]|nr:ssl1498 family light-harvesting-like protein [Leptolyngbyaceae cyanobacterium M65_K2018_010]